MKSTLHVIFFASICVSASASLITVQNSGFEDVWNDQLDDGWAWEEISSNVQFERSDFLWGGSAKGDRVLGLWGGACSQILSHQVTGNTKYTLSVLVGNPLPSPEPWNREYSVQLLASGNILAESNSANPSKGFSQRLTMSYTSDFSNPHNGENLEIRFVGGSHHVVFDDVSLSYEAVPEPSTFGFMIFTGLGLFVVRCKRNSCRTRAWSVR